MADTDDSNPADGASSAVFRELHQPPGEGVQAILGVNGRHLRLFSCHNAGIATL